MVLLNGNTAGQKGKNWYRVTRRVDEHEPTLVGGWVWHCDLGLSFDWNEADYNMYSTFLTASSGSVLFSRSNLIKRKDLCFSCLRLGLIRHRGSLRSSHPFSSD